MRIEERVFSESRLVNDISEGHCYLPLSFMSNIIEIMFGFVVSFYSFHFHGMHVHLFVIFF